MIDNSILDRVKFQSFNAVGYHERMVTSSGDYVEVQKISPTTMVVDSGDKRDYYDNRGFKIK